MLESRPVGLIVSLLGLMVGACAGASADSESRSLAASGVGVVAAGCGLTASVGSGVIVDVGSGEHLVVTVAHTIKGATDVVVVDSGGAEHSARVVAFDKDADLAALDVASLSAPAVPLAADPDSDIRGVDGSILTWGRDDGVEEVPIVMNKRLRVTIEDIYIDEVVERGALEIAGPVSGGDSGGPVLDANGDVVGIIYANSRGREAVAFATDLGELSELIASATSDTVDNGTCF